MEETILSTLDNINLDDMIYGLKNRLIKYNLQNCKIIGYEINSIPLNITIPNKKSISFRIGQCGNMINNLSGYTIGYNIYHIPEFCNHIIQTNFNMELTYHNYWNIKRKIINKINLIGLNLMEKMSQEDISEFHYYYFKYIYPTYNFRTMFLNCDSQEEFSWLYFIISFRHYYHFPCKFYWKIFKALIF